MQGNVAVPAWVTTKDPYDVVGTLKPGTQYRLVELSPPPDYILASPLPFTVEADGSLPLVVLRNHPDMGGPSPTPTGGGGGGGGNGTMDLLVNKAWQD